MSDSRFTRRSFLGGTAKLGLGAATAGVVAAAGGLVGESAARAAGRTSLFPSVEGLRTPPPAPANYWTFVSRPDLTPPGVSIKKAAGYNFSSAPKYIFIEPRVSTSGSMPAGSQPGVMILDLNGEMVWFKPLTDPVQNPLNFRVQTYKGEQVLTWFQGKIGPGYGVGGTGVIMNSSYKQIASVTAVDHPMDLHELLLTPEGTALLTAYDQAKPVVIGHAQEVDIATGDLVFDWACYPAVSPDESYVSKTGDYFHINSIDLWPGSERNLLISSRNCCALYLVERSTKKILWRLHGKKSDFNVDHVQFWYQHDARALADGSGVSVFDDASPPNSPEKRSWGKVINLDMDSRVATVRHEYHHTTSYIDTGSQGNCQLLPNGGHFIGWGAEPYFSEFAPSGLAMTGPLVLDGRFPNGVESYRSFSFDWIGHPPQPELALVVQSGSQPGEFTSYASWNGDTNTAVWDIEVGTSPGSLASYAKVPKSGFETVTPITSSGATSFRAVAYNSSGKVIGQSSVVSAT